MHLAVSIKYKSRKVSQIKEERQTSKYNYNKTQATSCSFPTFFTYHILYLNLYFTYYISLKKIILTLKFIYKIN